MALTRLVGAKLERLGCEWNFKLHPYRVSSSLTSRKRVPWADWTVITATICLPATGLRAAVHGGYVMSLSSTTRSEVHFPTAGALSVRPCFRRLAKSACFKRPFPVAFSPSRLQEPSLLCTLSAGGTGEGKARRKKPQELPVQGACHYSDVFLVPACRAL